MQDIKAPEEFFYATLARIDQKSAENPGRFSVVQGTNVVVAFFYETCFIHRHDDDIILEKIDIC